MIVRLACDQAAALEWPEQPRDAGGGERQTSREVDPTQAPAGSFCKVMQCREVREAEAVERSELRVDTPFPKANRSPDTQKFFEDRHSHRNMCSIRELSSIDQQSA